MLQRIQTLFLLGTALCMTLALFLPIWTIQIYGQKSILLYTQEFQHYTKGTVHHSLLMIMIFASIAIALVSIFMYKKRMRQVQVVAFNILLIAVITGLTIYNIFQFENGLEISERPYESSYGLAYFLPIIALLLSIFASKYIRKDEKLVRSADRMR